MIRLPNGRSISSLMLEGLCRAELRRTLQAQIEQFGSGELRWHIVASASADREELRRAFAARAAQVLGADTQLTIQFTGHIASTEQGKFLRAVVR